MQPTLDWTGQLILFLISLTANLFSAFAGGGAGLIQLPALIFLGLPFSIALATHKVASVALGIGASARHLRERALELPFALFILASGVPGVVLGASLILHVPDQVARVALGVMREYEARFERIIAVCHSAEDADLYRRTLAGLLEE